MADEIQYVRYDPAEIWEGMTAIYRANGGGLLYAGDEKEILLRSVQAILAQAAARHNTAANMRNVRTAKGEYLSMIGETKGVARLDAEEAKATLIITIAAGTGNFTLPAGSTFSYGGKIYFRTEGTVETLADTTEASVEVSVHCTEKGTVGNGVPAGTELTPTEPRKGLVRAILSEESAGGFEGEDDETYRQRILDSTFNDTVTGPELQYESNARKVSIAILDASAAAKDDGSGYDYGLEDGQVLISLLYREGVTDTEKENLKAGVLQALNPNDSRPMTDQVLVRDGIPVPYHLIIQYRAPQVQGEDAEGAVQAAKEVFQAWQEGALGMAFDPYQLISMLYAAGCAQVEIGQGSNIAGEPMKYRENPKTHYYAGEITLERIDL